MHIYTCNTYIGCITYMYTSLSLSLYIYIYTYACLIYIYIYIYIYICTHTYIIHSGQNIKDFPCVKR